jgi:hypothetical protein
MAFVANNLAVLAWLAVWSFALFGFFVHLSADRKDAVVELDFNVVFLEAWQLNSELIGFIGFVYIGAHQAVGMYLWWAHEAMLMFAAWKAWSVEWIVKEIVAESTKHFVKKIVDWESHILFPFFDYID